MEFPEHDNVCLPLEAAGTGCSGYIEVTWPNFTFHLLVFYRFVLGIIYCIILQAKEAILKVPDVLVGECQTISIPIINNSPCPVSFCVTVQQKLLDNGNVYGPSKQLCGMPLLLFGFVVLVSYFFNAAILLFRCCIYLTK